VNASTDAKAIRAWASTHGIDCPKTGLLPKRVKAAYCEAFGIELPAEPARAPRPKPQPAPEPEAPVVVAVSVDLPGDPDDEYDVTQHLANLVHAAWSAGRAAMLRDLIAQAGQ